MRAVNLLPQDAQPRRLGTPQLAPTLGVAASVVAVGVVAAAAYVESGTVANKQREVDALQLRLSQISTSKPAGSSEAAALIASRSQRIQALNAALSSRVAYDVVMRQIALVLPDDVWLDGLQFASASAAADAAAAAGTTTVSPDVTVTGFTYSADGVARLLKRLAVVPSLDSPSLSSAQVQQVGKKEVFHFSVTATLVRPGGAS